MRQYILRRLLMMIPGLFFASVLIFSLMRIVPGDAASLKVFGGEAVISDPALYEAVRQELGLDRPYLVQYADWIWRMICCADMGISYFSKEPVLQEILVRLPVTVELAVASLFVAVVIAIPAGVISSIRQDTWLDYVARLAAIGGLSVPGFWVGTLLLIFPAIWFGYLPPLGFVPLHVDPLANIQQFLFPAIALGASFSATNMRITRSQMLEVLRQDYIRTAWAKGLRERAVIYRHALRNAMIPVLTIIGIDFAYLLGRTVIIEAVFVLPGLGSSTLKAINLRDYPQIQGNILFIAFMFLIINLAVDVAYAWIDPRIRYQ